MKKTWFVIIILIATTSTCLSKTLEDNFLFSTVYIENKSTGQAGTGFITVRRINKTDVIWYLISNKHVLLPKPISSPTQTNNLLATAIISINTQSANDIIRISREIIIRNDSGADLVKGHQNPNVDVAGIIITPYLHDIFANPTQKLLGINEDSFADKKYIDQNFISIGDEALVIGYPLNLVEEGNVIPIARGVRIASKPDYDFRKLPAFLVDGTIIRGSSGSPVILPIRPYVWTEKQKVDISKIQQNQLIGIVASTIKDWEMVIRKIVSFELLQEFTVTDNANLGIVYKAETIRDVMDLFGFKHWDHTD